MSVGLRGWLYHAHQWFQCRKKRLFALDDNDLEFYVVRNSCNIHSWWQENGLHGYQCNCSLHDKKMIWGFKILTSLSSSANGPLFPVHQKCNVIYLLWFHWRSWCFSWRHFSFAPSWRRSRRGAGPASIAGLWGPWGRAGLHGRRRFLCHRLRSWCSRCRWLH